MQKIKEILWTVSEKNSGLTNEPMNKRTGATSVGPKKLEKLVSLLKVLYSHFLQEWSVSWGFECLVDILGRVCPCLGGCTPSRNYEQLNIPRLPSSSNRWVSPAKFPSHEDWKYEKKVPIVILLTKLKAALSIPVEKNLLQLRGLWHQKTKTSARMWVLTKTQGHWIIEDSFKSNFFRDDMQIEE